MRHGQSRGAVFAEYAFLLGLILVVAAAAVGALGIEVAGLYTWPLN